MSLVIGAMLLMILLLPFIRAWAVIHYHERDFKEQKGRELE